MNSHVIGRNERSVPHRKLPALGAQRLSVFFILIQVSDGPDEQVSLGYGNFNPERNFPSMFEPIHGSAFDIVGLERVTADQRFHTPDLGGKARTAEVTAAVIEAIHG